MDMFWPTHISYVKGIFGDDISSQLNPYIYYITQRVNKGISSKYKYLAYLPDYYYFEKQI